MRSFRNHLTAIVILVLFGCASHAPITPPKLSVDLEAQQDKEIKNNVEVMMKPIHSEEALKAFYGEDLIFWGMIPVHVSVKNTDTKPCYLGVEYTSLIYPDGKVSRALSTEQAYQKGRKSYGRAAGWGCAFGVIGAIPSLINVSQTNEKIKADYEARMLKSGEMPPVLILRGWYFLI